MNIEFFDPEKHSELVPDFFSDDVIEPTEMSHYRKVINDALDDIDEVYGITAEFKIVFAEIDVEKFREEFGDDIPPQVFFRGYSLSKQAHEKADENIMFLATSEEYE